MFLSVEFTSCERITSSSQAMPSMSIASVPPEREDPPIKPSASCFALRAPFPLVSGLLKRRLFLIIRRYLFGGSSFSAASLPSQWSPVSFVVRFLPAFSVPWGSVMDSFLSPFLLKSSISFRRFWFRWLASRRRCLFLPCSSNPTGESDWTISWWWLVWEVVTRGRKEGFLHLEQPFKENLHLEQPTMWPKHGRLYSGEATTTRIEVRSLKMRCFLSPPCGRPG